MQLSYSSFIEQWHVTTNYIMWIYSISISHAFHYTILWMCRSTNTGYVYMHIVCVY